MTRSGGRILMFGIISQGRSAVLRPVFQGALAHQRTCREERRLSRGDRARAAGTAVRLDPLISDVMALGDLKAAIGMLGADGGGQRMKIVLEHK